MRLSVRILTSLALALCLTGQPTRVTAADGVPDANPAQAVADYTLPSTNSAAAEPTAFAMAATIAHGRIYFGTDNDGVWYRTPAKAPADPATWIQVNTTNGLAENSITSMATDPAGRVWVGHVSKGVSVSNGEKWAHYDALNGPLSGHIYHIAACPTDGDVWLATDAGLSRYRQQTGDWQYLTAADGLPSNQIRHIAFAQDGTAFVAVAADGLAFARPADGYRRWLTVRTPGPWRMPLSASGKGLPSNVVNSTLVARDGTLYVATANGLGISKDRGPHWTFIRGRDWPELVQGLQGSPTTQPAQAPAPLAEDWCSALAEDGAGRIWIAHRHAGCSVLDPATGQVRIHTTGSGGGGIRTLLPLPGTADMLIGTYGAAEGGAGGFTIGKIDTAKPANLAQVTSTTPPALPSPARAPSLEQLQALTRHIESLPARNEDDPVAGWIGEDWMTRGDCVGRYGNEYNEIFAYPGGGGRVYQVSYSQGPHRKPAGEGVSHGALAYSGNNPAWPWYQLTNGRCLGEIRDGGMNHDLYPTTWDGPDLHITFSVPEGIYRVAPFFTDPRSHDGEFRDYTVELWQTPHAPVADGTVHPLARVRVTDYWPSLYAQFVITRPGRYMITVGRGQSCTAGINGLMIDRLDKTVVMDQYPGYYQPRYDDADLRGPDDASTQRITAAAALWNALDGAWDRNDNFALQRPYRLLAYRAAQAAGANPRLLGNWRWHLCLWTDADRANFIPAMQRMHKLTFPPPTRDEPATFP